MSEAQTQSTDDVELKVEFVDDTPEADRDRPIAPDQTENDDDIAVRDDDEAFRYKNRAQQRIKELSLKAHSERRAKEMAVREREEAARLAEQLFQENRRLKELAGEAEKLAIDQAKQRTETQIEALKREMREAMEAGDTERVVNAQETLQRRVMEHERFTTYRPVEPQMGHNGGPPLEDPRPRQEAPKPPEPDEKSKAWLSRNPWFDADGDIEHEMTGYAFTLHDKLVRRQGVDPRSDEYYEEIDKAVRRRFPEYFDTDEPKKQTPVRDATASAPTVVASAARSSKTTRTVHLTPSMMRLARRFGLSPEQYAAQYVKDYGNG